MKNIVKEMMEIVARTHDYEMAETIYKLLSELSMTWNCPTYWQSVAEELAEEYAGNDWIVENCKLWDFK